MTVASLLTPPGGHSQAKLRRAYRGAMLGLAVGNALGVPVEGAPGELVRRRYPRGVRDISPGEQARPWDDDVAQAVLLAEALLAGDRLDLDDLAARLLQWFRAGGRGIGWLTRQVVTKLEAGIPAAKAARRAWEDSGRTAAGNGAVMRCAPVALRWRRDPERLVAEARRSALVTHVDPRCEWSTVALVVALAATLQGADVALDALADAIVKEGAPPEVAEAIRAVEDAALDDFELDDPRAMGYTLKAMQVGLWALFAEGESEEVLVQVVSAGGDADTNGAVAGAALGARLGDAAIPVRWLEAIGGRDRLVGLADELLSAAQVG